MSALGVEATNEFVEILEAAAWQRERAAWLHELAEEMTRAFDDTANRFTISTT